MSEDSDAQSTTTLRACPFCGSDALTIEGYSADKQYVVCHGCDCAGPVATGGADEAKAAAVWNARATTA